MRDPLTWRKPRGQDAKDLEWVARVVAGDLDAYARLIDRHRDFVYSIALRIVGNETDAEDISQEAFVTAFRALGSFRRESKFSSWLYRIVVNLALAHEKKRQRSRLVDVAWNGRGEPPVGIAATDVDPEKALLDREIRQSVKRAIGALPPHYRVVLTLYHLEERSYEEVARVLDLPMGTVKTHLHRAREMLRRIVERQDLKE